MRAGFAHHKGGGEWVFLNDKMRDMLAEFGAELQRNERERLIAALRSADAAPAMSDKRTAFLWAADFLDRA